MINLIGIAVIIGDGCMDELWYIATLIIRCRVDGETQDVWTCDEQVRLIKAFSHEEAYEKSIRLGTSEEHSYSNSAGQIVYWEFVGLVDIEVLELRDGQELTSHIFRHTNPDSLVVSRNRLSIFSTHENN